MKTMNHTTYPAKLKNKSKSELNFIIQDCQESINALPDNPNNSYYADEICYCGMELKKRLSK